MNPVRVGDISSVKPSEISTEGDVEVKDTAEEVAELEKLQQAVDHEDMVHQDFLPDPSLKVGQVMLETGISAKEFVRFEVGQNLEEEQ